MTDTIPIAETFVSIQGEGVLAGTPSCFVRVSGCNLRCSWCDTPYASWKPEGEARSVESLVDEATGANVRHVVITGGEPMIFEPVVHLSSALRARGLHVTIETAGTVHRAIECDLMSISPKLASSTPHDDPRDPTGRLAERHEAKRIDIDALQKLLHDHSVRQLKFVACEPADLGEIESLLSHLEGWWPEEILLMPEGVDPQAIRSRSWVARACIERGWRYAHRLHIDLYGNKRGT